MRLLHLALKYDYGIRERGLSFEHNNFYDALVNMGHDVLYFDIGELHQKYGFEKMNRRLAEVVRAEKPDILFCVLFRYLDQDTMRAISKGGDTVTLNWFCDDQYRFEEFAHPWSPCFNWVVTTSQTALPKYQAMNYRNVIKSQWACNHAMYRKLDLPLKYDVAFVGQPNLERRRLVRQLTGSGVAVSTWGVGWENGRASQNDMIRIFNQSRINLNFTGGGVPLAKLQARTLYGRVRRWISVTSDRVPFGKQVKAALKGSSQVQEAAPRPEGEGFVKQIKGRNFEIPGCGGFMLSGRAENIEEYYGDDVEAAYFNTEAELVERARYYLDHEGERARIAQAGYERTLREHTYAHRFTEIFKKVGLPSPTLDDIFAGRVRAGETVEIQ
ncbi:MAG: glycosyltransferase [Chloroflexi bacterium]|nr:glycosyltransferase [Chloroflexota bacterium]